MKSNISRFWNTLLIPAMTLTLAGCAGSGVEAVHISDEPEIMSAPRVSYLGPEGTYTEEATKFFFPDASAMLAERTVDDAIAKVMEDGADYAVIPQENTLGGPVTNYVDALIAQNDIYVVGEVILPISQTLLGVPGSSLDQIKTVCSHAQGLRQSEKWRQEHLPDAVAEEKDSTAAAAAYVAEQQDPSIAAIAAPGAAELYGLIVLAENVQITMNNQTRFYVLAKEKLRDEGHPNAVFTVSCRAEEIDDIIVTIHNSGLELVALHDRPEGSALGSYNYLIEVSCASGITVKQIETVTANEKIHFFGSFESREKK